MDYNAAVKNQFFQPFYTNRIENHRAVFNEQGGKLDLAMTLFWHGVADFYGRLHLAGELNVIYDGPGINVGNSYKHFVERFFPSEWACKAKLLYDVYRNGMVHQLSPKYAAIQYIDLPADALLQSIPDPNDPTDQSKTIPLLNCRVYGELVYSGFKEFERRMSDNLEPMVAQNIYQNIILVNDSLGDQLALNNATTALTSSDPYGPCI